jgi:hypothetical protein
VKSLFASCAFLLFAIATSWSAPLWIASEEKTGRLGITGRCDEGELRIVINGPDVKIYAFLNSLERGTAATFDVSTVLGAKKAKAQWQASTEPGKPGTLLEAPNGSALLAELLKAGASTFSMRVTPAGKLSVVADFSLSGLEEHKARIDQALFRAARPPQASIKPANTR